MNKKDKELFESRITASAEGTVAALGISIAITAVVLFGLFFHLLRSLESTISEDNVKFRMDMDKLVSRVDFQDFAISEADYLLELCKKHYPDEPPYTVTKDADSLSTWNRSHHLHCTTSNRDVSYNALIRMDETKDCKKCTEK